MRRLSYFLMILSDQIEINYSFFFFFNFVNERELFYRFIFNFPRRSAQISLMPRPSFPRSSFMSACQCHSRSVTMVISNMSQDSIAFQMASEVGKK